MDMAIKQLLPFYRDSHVVHVSFFIPELSNANWEEIRDAVYQSGVLYADPNPDTQEVRIMYNTDLASEDVIAGRLQEKGYTSRVLDDTRKVGESTVNCLPFGIMLFFVIKGLFWIFELMF